MPQSFGPFEALGAIPTVSNKALGVKLFAPLGPIQPTEHQEVTSGRLKRHKTRQTQVLEGVCWLLFALEHRWHHYDTRLRAVLRVLLVLGDPATLTLLPAPLSPQTTPGWALSSPFLVGSAHTQSSGHCLPTLTCPSTWAPPWGSTGEPPVSACTGTPPSALAEWGRYRGPGRTISGFYRVGTGVSAGLYRSPISVCGGGPGRSIPDPGQCLRRGSVPGSQ